MARFTPEDQFCMREMHRAGIAVSEIARTLARSRTTVQTWLATNVYPLEGELPVSKTDLIKQDTAFCAAMENAIARGLERDLRRAE